MKRDIIQLAILPAIILSLLGFSYSLTLSNFISSLMGLKFSLISTNGLESFRISIAALFGVCPIFAYLLFHRKFQGDTQNQPITLHLRYMVYLLLGVIVAIAIDIGRIKLFYLKLASLTDEAQQWTSFIEQLTPLPFGFTLIIIIGGSIFFMQKPNQEV